MGGNENVGFSWLLNTVVFDIGFACVLSKSRIVPASREALGFAFGGVLHGYLTTLIPILFCADFSFVLHSFGRGTGMSELPIQLRPQTRSVTPPPRPAAATTTTTTTASPPAFAILALYYFVPEKLSYEAVIQLRDELEPLLRSHRTRGTILVAREGINGTICFPTEFLTATTQYFQQLFPLIHIRISYHPTENVFFRLKVKIKAEIVTLGKGLEIEMCDYHRGGGGDSSCDYDDNNDKEKMVHGSHDICCDPTKQVGVYVAPGREWDELIQDPECLVIDTRNEYEYRVGTFHRAINPHTESFVEFPAWLDQYFGEQSTAKVPQKVAMFCTGGIRCEKATSYCLSLLERRYSVNETASLSKKPQVYHLKGGILAYLDQVPSDQSLFTGECYVFDRRTAVQHGLKPSDNYKLCHACRNPLSREDRQHPDYREGVSCHFCIETRTDRRERYEGRQKQMILNNHHLHDPKEWQGKNSTKPNKASSSQ